LFKQSGLSAGAACGLHFLFVALRSAQTGRRGFPRGWRSGQAVFTWLAAFVAPAIVAISVLAAQGALGEARFAVGTFNRAYFEINDATWVHLDRPLRVYAETAFGMLVPIFVLAAIGLFAVLIAQRRASAAPSHRSGVSLFLLWFLLAAYLACVGPG